MESLKELLTIVKDLPGMTLWILGGFLFYKFFITGLIVGSLTFVAKLLINKFHDIKTKPVVKQYRIMDHFVEESTFDRFIDTLKKVSRCRIGYQEILSEGRYMFGISVKDLSWLDQAIDEKKSRDSQETTKTAVEMAAMQQKMFADFLKKEKSND